jgi:hypothetical protein
MWDFTEASSRCVVVHWDSISTSGQVVAEAEPRPLFGFLHQSASYRVAVHVFQLLYMLVLREYIEVIVAGNLAESVNPTLAAKARQEWGTQICGWETIMSGAPVTIRPTSRCGAPSFCLFRPGHPADFPPLSLVTVSCDPSVY